MQTASVGADARREAASGGDVPTPAQSAANALVEWLVAEYGGPVRLATPATSSGEGFDSDIHYLQFTGDTLPEEWRAPLVLRVKPSADRIDVARTEARIQTWLADRGYPAPRVLAVFAPGELVDTPAQVMERAPGAMMLDSVRRRPWQTRRRIAELAALHVRLHAIDPDGFPGDDDLLDRRLRLTRSTADMLDDPALRDGLHRIELISDRLRDAPEVVCHGDYHPLNVLVSDDGASVIDWTDAGLGDRHGDVARTLVLFDLAPIAASSSVERVVLRGAGPLLGRLYLRSYDRMAPLDPNRLALWKPVHLLHGWGQARGLHAGLLDGGENQARSTDRIPAMLVDELRRRFGAAIEAIAS